MLLTTFGVAGIGDRANFAVNLVLDGSNGARRHFALRSRHSYGDESESVLYVRAGECVCEGAPQVNSNQKTSTVKLGSVIPQKQT